jgi:serine/alanine adding enzyme
VELRHWARPAAVDLPSRTHKVTMWLDLPPEADTLWKQFRTELRTDIRRRLKDGLQVRIAGATELDNFYHVYSHNMRDLGTPVAPKAFFAAILAEWADACWIATVYHRDEPIASGFLVGFRRTLEIPWASALRSHIRLRPNMLLYWGCLQHAVTAGFSRFDFGRSTPDGGTHAFKKQWGAREVPLYWHYWTSVADTAPPLLTPDNTKFDLAVRAWKRLPLSLTRVIGPRLARCFP